MKPKSITAAVLERLMAAQTKMLREKAEREKGAVSLEKPMEVCEQ
jgi:hypothetical protein